MTYRDDDHSHVPDSHASQYAMVGGTHHPGVFHLTFSEPMVR